MSLIKKHPLACMVVALAILLAAVIVLIKIAYVCLDVLEFLIAWAFIVGIGALLLVKIVDQYEIIEINNYNKYKTEDTKQK